MLRSRPPVNLHQAMTSLLLPKVKRVEDVDELIKLWPRLLVLAKKEASTLSTDQLLQLFLVCLRDGAVFVVRANTGLCGFACVERTGSVAVLHCIPADDGQGLGKACLGAIRTWASNEQLDGIKATTTKLCGSSFRYFEKSLGFRRNSVTFLMTL